jgi:hypothetical protein
MKPDELADVLTTLADRRRLRLLLEVYRRRGEPPSGAFAWHRIDRAGLARYNGRQLGRTLRLAWRCSCPG